MEQIPHESPLVADEDEKMSEMTRRQLLARLGKAAVAAPVVAILASAAGSPEALAS